MLQSNSKARVLNLAALALLLVAHDLLAAQGQNTGVVHGAVEDPSRKPVPGAQVRLENKGNQEKFRGTTKETGEFSFPNLAEGEYTLSVRAKGFEEERLNIKVRPQPTRPLRIRLEIADHDYPD